MPMELIAGDARDILVVLGAARMDGLVPERDRYQAHLALGGGIDPTWLDLFAEAARATLDADAPSDFIDARLELGAGDDAGLTVERVDPAWVTSVAMIADTSIDAVAGGWIDRLEEDMGALPREEKPWIRDLAGQIVAFCRIADRAPDVIFVWTLP
ncbi:MAG: hypothetical protein ABIP77_00950 [Candidatus Limnocylindrales bacterium]